LAGLIDGAPHDYHFGRPLLSRADSQAIVGIFEAYRLIDGP
jgi:hypothetical protein